MKEEIREIYTDGIGKIHFLGGMLRLDLFSFNPSDTEDKSEPVITKRLIMSPNAFLASYESFVNMIDKLQEAGIISKNEEESKEEVADENNEESSNVGFEPQAQETTEASGPAPNIDASVKEEIVNPDK